MALRQCLLLALTISVIFTSHLVNGIKSWRNCSTLLRDDVSQCSQCNGSSSEQCYENCKNQSGDISDCESSTADVSCDFKECTREILGIPIKTFGIIVGAAAFVLLMTLVVVLCCCCCCCCYRIRIKKIESIKIRLMEQTDTEFSLVHQSQDLIATPPADSPMLENSPKLEDSPMLADENSFKMQVNEALRNDSVTVPSTPPIELAVLSQQHTFVPMKKSHSSVDIRESVMSDSSIQEKGGAYMKMKPIGSIRMSKSCQNIMEEEDIYVEPDQPHHHSSTLTPHATPLTLPGQLQRTPVPEPEEPENHYSNQEAINTQGRLSREQDGYQNVGGAALSVTTGNESYEYVKNYFQDENIDNSDNDENEYYNFIPRKPTDDEMYVYMKSGKAGTARTSDLQEVDKEEDRRRLQSEPASTKKYINLSREQQVNLRLPGSEYGEPIKDAENSETAAVPGIENGNENQSLNACLNQLGQQPIYANCNNEEELYTAMT